MKRSPLKTKPRKHKTEISLRQYGVESFRIWIHSLPCATCDQWHLGVHASHVISKVPRGRGTWRDIIPQCFRCHSEFHQKGRLSFCQARGWPPERLSELAAGYAKEWEELQSGHLSTISRTSEPTT